MTARHRAPRAAPWLALLAAAAAGAQPSAPASPDVPAGPAAIAGRLVHATRPDAVADVDVLLYALSADESAGLRQRRSDADGRFHFTGVSNDPGVVYLVGARLDEIPFGVRFSFAAGELEHRVELALSDPIDDTRIAAAAALDVRVESGCTHLRVAHRHALVNASNRVVFVPPDRRAGAAPILDVELPAEADGFESLGGGGLARDGRRVRFWGPLYPGAQSVEFAYGMPLETAAFAIGFPRGAPAPEILAPRGIVSLSGPGLRAAPDRAVGEQSYAVLRGDDAIAAGGSLPLAVAVAARTAKPALRTPRAELRLELDDAALEVDERIELAADRALGSAAAPLLCIPLPDGASELRFSSGTLSAGLRRDPSGDLAIHGPLPPGSSEISNVMLKK